MSVCLSVCLSVPGTGAEVTVAGTAHMSLLGIKTEHLTLPSHGLTHVAGGKVNVVGKSKLSFDYGDIRIIEVVYFIDKVSKLFLSVHACKKLKIIHQSFPLPMTEHAPIISEVNSNHMSPNVKPVSPITIPYEPMTEHAPIISEVNSNHKSPNVKPVSPITIPYEPITEHAPIISEVYSNHMRPNVKPVSPITIPYEPMTEHAPIISKVNSNHMSPNVKPVSPITIPYEPMPKHAPIISEVNSNHMSPNAKPVSPIAIPYGTH